MEDFEAKAIRVWMREVMANREWSANRWATLAGTSATNITRFLNGGKFLPSSKTLAKLSYVAGSSPQLAQNVLSNTAGMTIAVFDEHENKAGTMTVYDVKGDVIAYRYPRDCTTNGVKAGDIIVVRKQKKFEDGNLVLFFEDTIGLAIKLDGVNAVFQGKTKRTIKLSDVRVVGRVVQIIKNLDD